jgi:3-deoxy-D-manno-octulosonic-acid transferase
MINQYDIAYALGFGLSAPYWLIRPSARRKVSTALSQKMGRVARRDDASCAIMIHAVSLGEINATRALVDSLRAARPELRFIVSVTTDTGFARGQELYGSAPGVTLVRYPLDFSSAVDRFLDALHPAIVVLLELEVWPNFIHRCLARKIPVLLINGRVTPGSFRRYRLARPLFGGMFSHLDRVCVQDEVYAKRFAELGVPPDRLQITGTMKFDTAQIGQTVDGQDELAQSLRLSPGRQRLWVCGSTGPGEEEIILPIYRELRERFGDLRLAIIPRKPERFEEVAQIIHSGGFGLIRRSSPTFDVITPSVILGDTMGELRKFYALADLVFVGRSLVDLGSKQHGSDMIEPAALGKPVIVGPFTANFADAMDRFIAARAIEVAPDAAGLEDAATRLLDQPDQAARMGAAAQKVVMNSRGATARHVRIILDRLQSVSTITANSPVTKA